MTGRATVWVGAVTTLLFLTVGGSFVWEGRWLVGGAILALAVLRAVVLWRQIHARRAAGQDPPAP